MPAVRRPEATAEQFRAELGTGPVPYAAALAAGFSRGRLDAAVRRGLLERPRYGVLRWRGSEPDSPHRTSPTIEPATARRQHLDAVRAALPALGDGVYMSEESAAAVHGISTPSGVRAEQVRTTDPGGWGYSHTTTNRRGTPIPERHLTIVDGIPVTSLELTAVELARGRTLSQALIPLDSAVRLRIARATGLEGNALRHAVRDESLRSDAIALLWDAALAFSGLAGIVRVRSALPAVDPASESPLESRSRGWFLESGLGALSPGTPVQVPGATYWADFCDPARRVIGEADGWRKYGATTGDVETALRRERARADDLHDNGWEIVRWTSSHGRAAVVQRMRAALQNRRAA